MVEILNYTTLSGRDPVRAFISELPEETRIELFVLLQRLENGESLSMPHSRNLSSILKGLSELRVVDSRGQVRVFYYVKSTERIFLLHALRKKSRAISKKDKNLIIKRAKEISKER